MDDETAFLYDLRESSSSISSSSSSSSVILESSSHIMDSNGTFSESIRNIFTTESAINTLSTATAILNKHFPSTTSATMPDNIYDNSNVAMSHTRSEAVDNVSHHGNAGSGGTGTGTDNVPMIDFHMLKLSLLSAMFILILCGNVFVLFALSVSFLFFLFISPFVRNAFLSHVYQNFLPVLFQKFLFDFLTIFLFFCFC